MQTSWVRELQTSWLMELNKGFAQVENLEARKKSAELVLDLYVMALYLLDNLLERIELYHLLEWSVSLP